MSRPPEGCPLCHAEAQPFASVRTQTYSSCTQCRLVFLSPDCFLSPEAERAHYDSHENDPSDPRYRAFLSRLAEPLAERLREGAEGLDFGSGPGPTLSLIFEERGHPMRIYDPFFAPDREALTRTYDFITCTEVAEHFHAPRREFSLFQALLRPGGTLGVMTELFEDGRDFSTWRYARDPTHVCFYRRETLDFIAQLFGWSLVLPRQSVALFHKTEPSPEP